jgi:DNA-binding response OmpR family regulator
MKRVLIVEDESDALEMLQGWTTKHGWVVRTARSGRDAVEVGKTFQPDVLITDYFLQGELNGVDVIERLRAADAKVRCILVTGLLQSALLEGVRRIHGVPILTKPFDFRRLDELISAN